MKYAKYAEYKKSGVEWLGEVPKDWVMWKIAHACPYIASGTTPSSDSDEYYKGTIPWVTTSELRENIILDTKKKVSQKALKKFSSLKIHPKGSLAIAMYGATIGRLGIFGIEATTNQACCVMPPSDKLFTRYLFYWLMGNRANILNLSSGGGQPNVNQEKIASLKVCAPAYHEQQQIAAFLHKETAEIDTLMEKQEQLIKLLQEKRQAVISHAVTKGLNPAAKMKDSGVEWLGEVPAHWAILRNRRVIKTIEQGWSPQADNRPPSVDEWGVTKLSSVKQGKFYPQESKTLYLNDDPSRGMIVKEGDFLITRANTPKLVGDVCVVPALQHKKLLLCDLIYRITFSENVEPQFLCAFFLSESGRTQVKMDARGASMSMAKISQGHIKDWLAPIPPIEEQIRIVDYLNSQTKKIDQTIDAAKRAIDLLKERRTALISAAVTGKIDVRGAV